MSTHTYKIKENKKQSIANAIVQKQGGGKSAVHFMDSRPEVVQMRKLQEIAGNSARVQQFKALKEIARASVNLQAPVQKKVIRTEFPASPVMGIQLKSDSQNVAAFEKGLQSHLESLYNPKIGNQVVQRQYAEANWNTMATYNGGSAAKEVTGAFGKAGYVIEPALLRKVIFPLMDKNGFGSQRFAHGKGDEESGHQGDTDERVQACKQFLIQWAQTNPPGSGETSGTGSSYKVTEEDIERHKQVKEEKRIHRQLEKEQEYKEEEHREYQENDPDSAYEDPNTPIYSKYLIELGLKQKRYPPELRPGSKEQKRYLELVERYK